MLTLAACKGGEGCADTSCMQGRGGGTLTPVPCRGHHSKDARLSALLVMVISSKCAISAKNVTILEVVLHENIESARASNGASSCHARV